MLITVPSTYGMSIDQATSVLEDAGFTVAVGGEIDSQLDTGLIAGSYPRSGTARPAATRSRSTPPTGRRTCPRSPSPSPREGRRRGQRRRTPLTCGPAPGGVSGQSPKGWRSATCM